MRRAPVMSALAAMMLHARKVLDRDTSSHLVANALTPHVMAEADGLDLGPLPTVLDSLRARVAQDVRIRSAHPSYPYAYPESVDDLLVELAAVWSAYEQGHDPEDPLRALLRAHREDPELSFKVRLEAGRWYVSAWRAGRVSLAMVERIAKSHERVRRDASGEILGGGNTYVSVARDSASAAELRAPVRLEIGDLAIGADVELTCGAIVRRDSAYEYTAYRGPLAAPVIAYGVDAIARLVSEADVDFGARPAPLTERECAEQLPVPGLAPVVRLAVAS